MWWINSIIKKLCVSCWTAYILQDDTWSPQYRLRNSLNECPHTIHKDENWKYINMNHPPTIRCLVKIHKPDAPIRPIINWKEAPAYKLAKQLAKNLEKFIPLPHIYNVEKYLKSVSFNITNMYTNIPMKELIKIIENMCKQNDLDRTIYKEIVKTCKLIITQNYFQHTNIQYLQEQGLAMEAPTSYIFSEYTYNTWKTLRFSIFWEIINYMGTSGT